MDMELQIGLAGVFDDKTLGKRYSMCIVLLRNQN
jgi:hypothetical protein